MHPLFVLTDNFFGGSLLVVHEQVAIRTCGGGDVRLEVDVTLFGIEDDATEVHVIALAADSTGGYAVAAHRQPILGVIGAVVLANAVGALLVVGSKTTVGRIVERLETYNDAVVHAQYEVCLRLQCRLTLTRRPAIAVLEVQIDIATLLRFADEAEDATGIGVHGLRQRLVKIVGIMVENVTRLIVVLALAITGGKNEE